MAPGTALEAPGVDKTVNRNMTLVPRVRAQDPRSYVGFPGGCVAPRSCFFAPRNCTKASGSKIAPRAKNSFPGLIEFDPGNHKIINRTTKPLIGAAYPLGTTF
jgi:hypothetical protein